MSKLAKHFPIVTLSGYSASCFSDLFQTAKEFLAIHPDCVVQFEFNGQLIGVNDYTHDDAWAKYIKSEFPKVQ